ncbi:MAG: O-antigen ligase family protein [bacterium]
MSFQIVFMAQALVCIASYFLFFRENEAPRILKLLVVVAYLTVPLTIIVTGIASAIYVSDLMLPVLIIYLVKNNTEVSRILNDKYVVSIFFLLIVLPIITGLCLSIIGDYTILSLDSAIWFYRNLNLVIVLIVGMSTKMDQKQTGGFLEINLYFGVVLSIAGLVSYFTPFKLAIFESIRLGQQGSEILSYQEFGYGFLGLFRGSTGQWFVLLILMAIGGYSFISRGYKKVAWILILSGTGVILLSYSRIALIGLATGLLIIGMIALKGKRKIVMVIVIAAIALWFYLEPQLVENRYSFIEPGSIQTLFEQGEVRIRGWEESIEYLEDNGQNVALGIGPANTELSYKITGLYGPHNEYINAIFTSGIFELLLLFFVLWQMIMRLYQKGRNSDKRTKQLFWGFIAIVVANIVIGITQAHLLHDYATYTFGFYLFLIYGAIMGSCDSDWSSNGIE